MVERVGLVAKLRTEAGEALLLQRLAGAPDAAGVMSPAVITLDLRRCPALRVVLAGLGEVDREAHAARRRGHLPDLAPVEDLGIVRLCGPRVAREAQHPTSIRIEHHRLLGVATREVLPELVRQDELKHHAAAKIESRLRVVQVDKVLSQVAISVVGVS